MDKQEIEQEVRDILLKKTDNLKVLTAIKDQLGQAKAAVIADGIYSDPKWFASASTALRIAGRTDQELATRLGQLKKQLKDMNVGYVTQQNASFDRAFVETARLKLSGEMFNSIRDIAIETSQQS